MLTNKLTARVLAVALAIAVVASFGAGSAAAFSQAEVDAVCALFGCDDAQRAALEALVSGSGGTCPALTQPLTVGSTGQQVTDLQTFLVSAGTLVMPAGVPMGYFGPITQSAVAAWQAANGVAPAVGYWGPISLAAYNASCVASDDGDDDGDDDDSGDVNLQGGAGSLSDVDFISGLNNEEVGEGEEDVEVAGLEIEAEGSDIMLLAVTLDFDYADTGADDDLDDYADEVSVWFDGKEVARVDAGEFDDDNNYRRSVSLASGAVIDEDETGDLVVALSGVKNLDSANAGENWNVSFRSVRYQDAQDAIITDSDTGDIGESDDDTTTDSDERGFSFESFSTAADTEVKFDEDDDEINDAHVIDIHATNDTDGVPIFSFTIEVEGDADVNLDDLPVEFDSVGVDLEDALSGVALFMDGEEVGNENVPGSAGTNETITFEDMDLDLEAGETYSFVVEVDLQSIADGIAAGDTIAANIGATERAAADLEDENGDDIASGDRTGTATGEAHALYDDGISVSFTSVTESVSFVADEAGEKDKATFVFKFDVTAFGADAFLDKDTVATATPSASTDGQAFATTSQSTTGTTTSSSIITSSSNDGSDTSFGFIIDENDTRSFTLTIVSEAGIDGQIQQQVTGIKWGASGAGDTSADQLYNFNLDDFLSDAVAVNVF